MDIQHAIKIITESITPNANGRYEVGNIICIQHISAQFGQENGFTYMKDLVSLGMVEYQAPEGQVPGYRLTEYGAQLVNGD